MELQCNVQNYEWGKLGKDSIVAKLLKSADPSVSIDESKPYAELWMGTHPNGPSLIIERNVLLSEYIKDNLDAIGPVVRQKFGVAVPFLLKVLSIRKALSVQAHPKKEHAEELHKAFPDMYKDPNHKPELAIALTPFEALCGFRPLVEIQDYIRKLPELRQILSKESVDNFLAHGGQGESDKVLKPMFQSLMTSNKNTLASSLNSLLERLANEDEATQNHLLFPVVHRLHQDFPGDVGCWGPFFMNYMELRPGQAIFLRPNLPHAYLSGDCIECMACSDNVVRAGLTPKHIDVPTLVSMLDYSSYATKQLLFNPQLEDENCCVWRPPVTDFAVAKIRVESGDSYNTINRPSPSLVLITSGAGSACDTEPVPARPGVCIFLKVESGDSYNTINRPSPSLVLITSGAGSACDTEPVPARPGVCIFLKVESGDSYNTINRPSPSLVLITSGAGSACDTEPVPARPGVCIFLKASRQLTLTPSEGAHLEAYQAMCNV